MNISAGRLFTKRSLCFKIPSFMNQEPRNLKLKTLNDLVEFGRQNKPLAFGGVLGLILSGVSVGVVNLLTLDRRLDRMEEKDKVWDAEMARLAEERLLTLDSMIESYTPCTKEDDLEILQARSWLMNNKEKIIEWIGLVCTTYDDCPLATESSLSTFRDDFKMNLYTAQFFCPPSDEMEDESETLASTNLDSDLDRVPQIFLRPEALSKGQADPCRLVETVAHELIHATGKNQHDYSSDDYVKDWAYVGGYYAGMVCRGEITE